MMLDGKPGGAAVGHILHKKQGHWILDEESVLFKVGAGPAHILVAYSEEYLLEAQQTMLMEAGTCSLILHT